MGLTLVVVAILAILLVLLRYRVAQLNKQISGKQSSVTNLASELEAQALLVRQMSVDLEELRKRLVDHEERVPATGGGDWGGTGLPLNLNRRGQILRLSRKGRSVAEIASDLNIAQGEVELLLKVYDLTPKASGAEI